MTDFTRRLTETMTHTLARGLMMALLLLAAWLATGCSSQQESSLSALHFFNRGNEAYGLEDYRGAIRNYQRALDYDDQSPDIQYNLGLSYFRIGEYELAAGAYHQAIRLNPDFSDAHMNLALTYDRLYNQEAAHKHYNTYRQMVAGTLAKEASDQPPEAQQVALNGGKPAAQGAEAMAKKAKLPGKPQRLPGVKKNPSEAAQGQASAQDKKQPDAQTAKRNAAVSAAAAANAAALGLKQKQNHEPTRPEAGANPQRPNKSKDSDKWWIQEELIPKQ